MVTIPSKIRRFITTSATGHPATVDHFFSASDPTLQQ